MYTSIVRHLTFLKLSTRSIGDLNSGAKSVPGFHVNFVAVFQAKGSQILSWNNLKSLKPIVFVKISFQKYGSLLLKMSRVKRLINDVEKCSIRNNIYIRHQIYSRWSDFKLSFNKQSTSWIIWHLSVRHTALNSI